MSDTKPPKRKANSIDVATLAGVSRSAVSRTFTDGASVSEETRNKVMRAAEQLGYRVNALARSLHKRSELVGLVTADMHNPFRAEQIDWLSKLLGELGFKPILLRGERQTDVSDMIGSLLEYRVAGVIITSDTPPQEICEECQRYGVPLVTINKQDTGAPLDRVICDFEAGGRIAFEHLYAVGCRKMGLVLPEQPSYTIAGRADAFRRLCEKEGLELTEVRHGGQDYTSGLGAADLVGAQKDRIEGLFCVADYFALGILDGLRRKHGVRFPQDMRLIGFDDIPEAGWDGYAMTTIRQSRETLARLAIDLLCRRIDSPELDHQELICPLELVVRET